MSCESQQTVQSAELRTGRVFNIQRYSLNDGEGIRTVVFFKGCPLTCPWCANPESRSPKQQVNKRMARCIRCEVCTLDLPELSLLEQIDECPSGALELIGQDMTVAQIVSEVEKDSVFFRTSGGGVTLSGGEVMAQAPFAIELAKQLKQLGYPVAIETTGQGNGKHLLELGLQCDEVLYDFKIMQSDRAKQVTGIDLDKSLANFRMLIEAGVNVIPRLPLIPGETLDLLNVDRVLTQLKPFDLKEIHLLPFHQYGAGKYDNLDMEYQFKDVAVPDKDQIDAIQRHVESAGYKVTIGG